MRYFSRSSIKPLLKLLVLIILAGCGAEASDEAEMVRASEAPLYASSRLFWPSRDVQVCWLGSGFATERQWVRDSVLFYWGFKSGLVLHGWQDCPPNTDTPGSGGFKSDFPGIRIQPTTTSTNQTLVTASGTLGPGNYPTVILDFSAAPQTKYPRCHANSLNRENCIRATALHEFGHAIGFEHEHQRPTTPASCTETGARSGGGDYTFGNYDPNSIMNYCTPKAVPSNFDLAGLIDIYGPEVGQPMAQRTSGLCIGPALPNASPPEGMNATLDGFCFGEDGRSWLGMELTASGLLRSVYSGMCLVPEGSGLPENNARLLYTSACYPTPVNAVFFLTAGGSFMHFLSGKCVTPSNGSSNPARGTPLVLSPNCNNASQQFKGIFKANSRIGHNSGLCIHPEGGSANPTNDTRAVLQNDCRGTGRTDFVMTASGSLQHVSSGKCLHPSGGSTNPANNTEVVFWSGCDESRLAFELTARGSLRHVASGKCLHPKGGLAEPAAGTKLVFHDGCDEDRLRFGAVYW